MCALAHVYPGRMEYKFRKCTFDHLTSLQSEAYLVTLKMIMFMIINEHLPKNYFDPLPS